MEIRLPSATDVETSIARLGIDDINNRLDGQSVANARCFVFGRENNALRPITRQIELHAKKQNISNSQFLICGKSGVGKTHLLDVYVSLWKQHRTSGKAIFISGESLYRDYVHAVELDELRAFRHRYESANFVALDNLSEIANREPIQSEVERLIDIFRHKKTLFIASAQQYPTRFRKLTARLTSRIMDAHSYTLQPPKYAARHAILADHCRKLDLELPDSAIQRLAAKFTGTVPLLWKTLAEIKLISQCQIQLTKDQVVHEYIRNRDVRKTPTIHCVSKVVAKHFHVRTSELHSLSRKHSLAHARSIAMFICRQLTTQSLQSIGKYFRGRDHSTVLYSCRKIATTIQNDDSLRMLVSALNERIQQNVSI